MAYYSRWRNKRDGEFLLALRDDKFRSTVETWAQVVGLTEQGIITWKGKISFAFGLAEKRTIPARWWRSGSDCFWAGGGEKGRLLWYLASYSYRKANDELGAGPGWLAQHRWDWPSMRWTWWVQQCVGTVLFIVKPSWLCPVTSGYLFAISYSMGR